MATLLDIDKVRRAIGDTVKTNVEQLLGDGSTVVFGLAFHNVQDITVTVDGVEVTPTSTYAGSGQIQLPTAPSEDSKVIFSYSYAGFLDSILASLIDAYSVDGAIIECLKDLLASASRRSDYTQGQTKVNASQVFKNLKDLLDMYMPGGSLSSSGGLTVGRRTPQTPTLRTPPRDLSRDDSWSDNNVG